jgi:multimeric flavodoxin WrbA
MGELSKFGDVQCTEFFLPEAIPKFCTGCQLCLGNPHEKCPHSEYVSPILNAILDADALVFTTPHYGACSMTAGMKNLLDHLDFLTMTVAPRAEVFHKKAFIITTAAGSTAAIKPIEKYLKNWGINRVNSLGLIMFIDKWSKMPEAKQTNPSFE